MSNTKVNKSGSGFEVVRLEFVDIPQAIFNENKSLGYITYGLTNDYPNYLLDLFSKSAKHGAIVRGKVDFILGNGFAFKDEGLDEDKARAKTVIEKANASGESLEEVTAKVVTDMEIFGGGYFEIIYAKNGRVGEIYHVDFSKIRTNYDLSEFYYAEDWQITYNGVRSENTKPSFTRIPAFDKAGKRKGKEILYLKNYSPAMGCYPLPDYQAALRYIQIDIAISEFHLNGITNGMFSSKLINFNNGIPEPEQQKEIESKLNKKFAGSKNAGKIMISFNKSTENSPTILDLSGTELDKHFDLLNKTVEQHIFTGHRITSGSLFGVKSEAVFGNRAELRDAFELLQNTYINGKQKLIEKNINTVLEINRIPTVYLQRSEPVGYEFSEATIAKALTDDEIRDKLGYKPRAQTAASLVPEASKFKADSLDDEADFIVFSEFGKKKVIT